MYRVRTVRRRVCNGIGEWMAKSISFSQQMATRRCLVTCTDMRGVKHTAEVQAETVFEAAVLGLSALKRDDWSGQFGPMTKLDVQVMEPVIHHSVTVQQLQR